MKTASSPAELDFGKAAGAMGAYLMAASIRGRVRRCLPGCTPMGPPDLQDHGARGAG
jgi:hypothetical protein